MLLSNGADVNSNDEDGRSALLMAESLGYREIVNLLKRGGAISDSMLHYKQRETVHQVRHSDHTNLGSFSLPQETRLDGVRAFKPERKQMSIWKKLFGGDFGPAPSPTPRSAELGEDPATLYEAASDLFRKERFKEALNLFEKLGRIDASSTAVHFMLGMTYTRLGGQLCSDDDSLVPWLRKSVAAFRRASELASEHGGLTAEQRSTASEAALHGERVIERHSPSIPEERRRRIYADLMETMDTEFLLDTSVDRGMEEASRKISLKMMQEAISKGGARAEVAALDKVIARHNVSRGQLLAIKEEGREKKWPFKAVTR